MKLLFSFTQSFLQSSFTILGLVVVIFAMIERFSCTSLPWINAWVAIALLRTICLLWFARWTNSLKAFAFIVRLFGAFLLLKLVFGGSMLGIPADWQSDLIVDPGFRAQYEAEVLPHLDRLLRGGLFFGFVGAVVGVTQAARRMVSRERHSS